MEWSWLKDWWRLKKFHHRHRKTAHNISLFDIDEDFSKSKEAFTEVKSSGANEDTDDDSFCFCDAFLNVILFYYNL